MLYNEQQGLICKIKNSILDGGKLSSVVALGTDDNVIRITKNGITKQLCDASYSELSAILRDLTIKN